MPVLLTLLPHSDRLKIEGIVEKELRDRPVVKNEDARNPGFGCRANSSSKFEQERMGSQNLRFQRQVCQEPWLTRSRSLQLPGDEVGTNVHHDHHDNGKERAAGLSQPLREKVVSVRA
jgi:hypothetical protein